MTGKPEIDEAPESGWKKYGLKETSQVVNPHAFGPTTADFCMVAWLGRDLDLSFFSVQPTFLSFGGFRPNAVGPATAEGGQDYVQTGRIRLSAPAAAHVVGNLMTNLRQADRSIFESTLSSLVSLADGTLDEEESE